MRTTRRRLLLGLLLATAAVEGAGCKRRPHHGSKENPAQACASVGALAFGEKCASDCECSSSLCAEFGDGARVCSKPCEAAAECPPGSRGKKCSQQGFCRP
jgi:hypothetical protein